MNRFTHSTFVAVASFALLASSPARAGFSFQQSVRSTGAQGSNAGDSVSTVRSEGEDARVEFQPTQQNPLFGAGTYILMRGNAPAGIFLVDPKAKSYSKLDLSAITQATSSMTNGSGGGGMKMEASDAKLEKLGEEPGGEIEGLPTTKIRLRKSYRMTMTMAGMAFETVHEIMDEIWVTTGLQLGGDKLQEVIGRMGGTASIRGLGDLGKLEREALGTGFPLKRVTVDHSKQAGKGMMAKMMRGKEETVTTTIEISHFERSTLDAALFEIPAGFRETQMMQPGGGAPDLEGGN